MRAKITNVKNEVKSKMQKIGRVKMCSFEYTIAAFHAIIPDPPTKQQSHTVGVVAQPALDALNILKRTMSCIIESLRTTQ